VEQHASEMGAVVIAKKIDGSWMATHVPSGRVTHGESKTEAEDAMRTLLGATDGDAEPLTSPQFSGPANSIALFLEGPISEMLKLHSGFARLEAYEGSIAHIRLGGGCQGCPSSRMTLLNSVYGLLRDEFGEEQIQEVVPVEF
jgi:Fe-S cluster biogenesis protein NfuA